MLFLVTDENRTFCFALIGSLLIHALLFILSGKTFIQQAKFSVQSSSQTVEVSIKEMGVNMSTATTIALGKEKANTFLGGEAISERTNASRNDKNLLYSKSGIKVKANPDYFQNPPPEYPPFAKQMRQEGLVLLSVDVNGEGMPIRVDIAQSSGYRMLDQAALKAVRNWKFQPGRLEDISIESTVIVPIRFKLEK